MSHSASRSKQTGPLRWTTRGILQSRPPTLAFAPPFVHLSLSVLEFRLDTESFVAVVVAAAVAS